MRRRRTFGRLFGCWPWARRARSPEDDWRYRTALQYACQKFMTYESVVEKLCLHSVPTPLIATGSEIKELMQEECITTKEAEVWQPSSGHGEPRSVALFPSVGSANNLRLYYTKNKTDEAAAWSQANEIQAERSVSANQEASAYATDVPVTFETTDQPEASIAPENQNRFAVSVAPTLMCNNTDQDKTSVEEETNNITTVNNEQSVDSSSESMQDMILENDDTVVYGTMTGKASSLFKNIFVRPSYNSSKVRLRRSVSGSHHFEQSQCPVHSFGRKVATRPSAKSLEMSSEKDVLRENAYYRTLPCTCSTSEERLVNITNESRSIPSESRERVVRVLSRFSSLFPDNEKDAPPKDPLTMSPSRTRQRARIVPKVSGRRLSEHISEVGSAVHRPSINLQNYSTSKTRKTAENSMSKTGKSSKRTVGTQYERLLFRTEIEHPVKMFPTVDAVRISSPSYEMGCLRLDQTSTISTDQNSPNTEQTLTGNRHSDTVENNQISQMFNKTVSFVIERSPRVNKVTEADESFEIGCLHFSGNAGDEADAPMHTKTFEDVGTGVIVIPEPIINTYFSSVAVQTTNEAKTNHEESFRNHRTAQTTRSDKASHTAANEFNNMKVRAVNIGVQVPEQNSIKQFTINDSDEGRRVSPKNDCLETTMDENLTNERYFDTNEGNNREFSYAWTSTPFCVDRNNLSQQVAQLEEATFTNPSTERNNFPYFSEPAAQFEAGASKTCYVERNDLPNFSQQPAQFVTQEVEKKLMMNIVDVNGIFKDDQRNRLPEYSSRKDKISKKLINGGISNKKLPAEKDSFVVLKGPGFKPQPISHKQMSSEKETADISDSRGRHQMPKHMCADSDREVKLQTQRGTNSAPNTKAPKALRQFPETTDIPGNEISVMKGFQSKRYRDKKDNKTDDVRKHERVKTIYKSPNATKTVNESELKDTNSVNGGNISFIHLIRDAMPHTVDEMDASQIPTRETTLSMECAETNTAPDKFVYLFKNKNDTNVIGIQQTVDSRHNPSACKRKRNISMKEEEQPSHSSPAAVDTKADPPRSAGRHTFKLVAPHCNTKSSQRNSSDAQKSGVLRWKIVINQRNDDSSKNTHSSKQGVK